MTLNAINNTLFVGNVWYHFDSLHSTNDLALNWLSQKPNKSFDLATPKPSFSLPITEGVVLTTFNQTLGRGQMGNQWLAEPHKNIAFTVILFPTFLEAREQFHLNKSIALAVHDCMSNIFQTYNPALAHGCTVKWANDLYFYDQKLGGILIQNALAGSRLQHTVAGIGLNINQLDFPKDLNVTSLKRELKMDFDLFVLVEQLAKCIELRYLELKKGHFKRLHDEYLSKMYRFEKESLFQYPTGEVFRGTIVGVSEFGRLEILTTEGVKSFDIKEVKFVI
ncbi:MAG: biotin--[acetyl-CoA-carboxylase] ligase [Saprospiraceae bacterium]|nr:biotin--[acetyl-CoA-carboxylase] ligase [Saprospiraceae bacterium]